MKKKVTFVVLGVLILSMLLCSCGGEKVSDNSNEIHWYMPKVLDNIQGQNEIEEVVNKELEATTGSKIRLHLIDRGSYNEKINMMMSSGEESDIIYMTINEYVRSARLDGLTDITEMLKEYGPDIIAKTDPVSIQAATLNGKLYAIPSQNPFANTKVYVFKKEFVDKYNVDYQSIKSLDDLEPYLEMIKKNEPGIIPLLAGGIGVVQDTPFYGYTEVSPGIMFDENAGKFISVLDVPVVQKYLKRIKGYYDKGYIAKDVVARGCGVDEIKSGNYAVMMTSGAYSADGSKSSSAYGFPCVESLIGYEEIQNGAVLAAMNAISSTSKKPEAAIKVLNQIWKDPFLSNTLAYGLEGKDYEVLSDNNGEKSVKPKSGKDQSWAEWHNTIGPLWDQWDSSWNSKESLLEMQENNKKAKASSLLGFLVDTEPIKNELAQISAVYTESNTILGTGSMPDFDEYIANVKAKFDNAGMEKALEEITKQYNEWVKTK